jgi:iron complex outermembrane recepter protein
MITNNSKIIQYTRHGLRMSVRSALHKSTVAVTAGVLGLSLSTAASGQSEPATNNSSASTESTQLDEIIVTANKIAEPVQKVAQTVNVVSADTIADLHVQNIIELNSVVGGLSLTMTSPSEQSVSLRGIKMVNGTPTSNTVESYLNEVPISTIDAFGATLDIAQVEVLKGPQGTLRGRPSPSGAMTIATQKGSFTDYSGYADLTGSDHDGRRAEVAFGGPISETLAFRVAGLYDHNALTEVKSIGNGESNFQETSIGRATLDWAPTDDFSLDVMLQYTRQKGDFYRQSYGTPPCAGSLPAPYDTITSVGCGRTLSVEDKIALNTTPNPNHYYGKLGTVTARYALTDHLDLNYVGGYNDNEYYNNLSFDFAGVGTFPGGLTFLDNTAKTRTISNELRLQSNANEVYNFTYGVFLSDQHLDGVFRIPPFTPPGGALTDTTTKDFGAFTNQRFALSEKDDIQVGVRYSKTEIEPAGQPSREYNSTTGNASYQHQFTDDMMAYLSFGTAFRPGSANSQNPPQASAPLPRELGNFEEEKSKSYELGFKSQWLDRRLTLNLAIFDQKYTGYISQQFNVACTGVPSTTGLAFATNDGTAAGTQCFGTMRGNGDAESRGVEFEFRARLTDNWTFDGIYTYTDAKYANAFLPCNDYNGDGVTDTNGTPMVQQGEFVSFCSLNTPLGSLPKVSFTASTTYDLMLGSLPAYIRANSYTRSSSYFPQTGTTFSGFTTVNTTIGVHSPDEKWDFNVWVKNVFDTVHQDTDGGPWNIGPHFSGVRLGTVTNDREIGATVRFNF